LALASDTHLVLQMNRAGDIEDDRRTAETVRESERQWQEVFEHNPSCTSWSMVGAPFGQ
jgi:hypothetical protein